MKRENHRMMRLCILLFSISVSVAIVPCGVVNVYGALGEVYSSVTIEAEKETQLVREGVSNARKEKGINIYKENVNYIDRIGAYLIPSKEGKIGVVKTTKGYFLLGGGLDSNESHEECIMRECLEEIGYTVSVGNKVCSAEMYSEHPTIGHFHPIQTYYVGELLERISTPTEEDHVFEWVEYNELVDNMYLEMQSWALKQCMGVINL